MTFGEIVPRGTPAKLDVFSALVRKWSPKINLVSPNDLGVLDKRHIEDCSQLLTLVEPAGHWVDLGSGAGFPGLVVAIQAGSRLSKLTLVESDRRKAAFLRVALRETGSQGVVLDSRIEHLAPLDADILSARALAPLPLLLEYAHRHLKSSGVAIFPKGANWKPELEAARIDWRFHCEVVPSKTDPKAVILIIGGLTRD